MFVEDIYESRRLTPPLQVSVVVSIIIRLCTREGSLYPVLEIKIFKLPHTANQDKNVYCIYVLALTFPLK